MSLGTRLSGFLRRSVYAFELLLEGRLALFVVADLILVFQGLLRALLGNADLDGLYRFLVVVPILVLGVLVTASVVALERRAGSLDLALAVPSTEHYFVRRVAPVCAFLLAQAWLLFFVAYLIIYEKRFFEHLLSAEGLFVLPAMLHAALVALLTGTVTLFWAARISTTGGTAAAAFLTLFALSKWIFKSPILQGLGPSVTWLAGFVPPVLLELVWNLGVLAIAAAIFFLYARERLRRPEKMLGE